MEQRPLAELSPSGMLWLINRVVFHPRGFALALHTDDAGEVTGWSIEGDGVEPWTFPEDIDDRFHAAAEATLTAAATAATTDPGVDVPAGPIRGSTGHTGPDA